MLKRLQNKFAVEEEDYDEVYMPMEEELAAPDKTEQ
jgi:hypothetical protein